MGCVIFFFGFPRTRRISPDLKHTHWEYFIDIPDQPFGDDICITPIELSIPDYPPCIYFDAAIISTNTYRLAIIIVIGINMTPPDREQVVASVNVDPPGREQFMAGVNSTGPDGRLLPAGAAAAARMTAAHAAAQEAERQQDEDTFSTASTAIEEAKREEESAKKKKAGVQKSLVRRLFGGVGKKFAAAALKRDQEKKDQ